VGRRDVDDCSTEPEPTSNERESERFDSSETRDEEPNDREGDEHADVPLLDVEVGDATLLAKLVHDTPRCRVWICRH
jgi:hypothetical protein